MTNTLKGLFAAALMVLTPHFSANAQDWPAKPVTIITPALPGDASDIIGRLMVGEMGKRLGTTFVMVNKPGAGGIIGSMEAARAKPDGYTFILATAGSHGINGAIYTDLPYDPIEDFVPVSLVYKAPNIFVTNKELPIKTLPELISYVKERPDQLYYSSGGIGSSAHMNTEYLAMLTGMRATHVPYKGASAALADLLALHVSFMAVNLPPALPLIESGRLTPLAVTSLERSSSLPDVPTVDESGLKGFETTAWFGMFAPKGTSAAIVDRFSAEIKEICQMPEIQKQLATLGGTTVCGSPQEFAEFQRNDIARWKQVAEAAGIMRSIK